MRKTVAGLVAAGISGILYGAITVGAKASPAAPLAKAAIFAASAGLALAWALVRFRPQREDLGKLAIMALVGGAIAPALVLYGLEEALASHAGLLLTVELVGTAIIAFVFLGERFTPRAMAGLGALLAAGAAVALASTSENDSTWRGLLLVGLGAAAFAIDNAVSTVLVGDYRPHQLVAAKCLGASVPLGIAWSLVGGAAPQEVQDWGFLVVTGLLGLGLGSLTLYLGLARIGAARAVAVTIPVSGLAAAGGGWLVLGESLSWLDAVACALVACGILLLWEHDRPAKAS